MDRRWTPALGALAALLLVVGATAVASPADRQRDVAPAADPTAPPSGVLEESDEPEGDGTPSAQLLSRLVNRLSGVGIATDEETVADLAADYGVGGAVRLLTWADASGLSTAEIAAMFDAGTGWGEIARRLNEADDSLDLRPGIGWVMGNGGGNGGGLGRENAPGQQKKQQ